MAKRGGGGDIARNLIGWGRGGPPKGSQTKGCNSAFLQTAICEFLLYGDI